MSLLEAAASFQAALETQSMIELAQQTGQPLPDWMSAQHHRLLRDGLVVGIGGSRTFTDDQVIYDAVDSLVDRQVRIIVGDAPDGVDRMVRDYLARLAIPGWEPESDVFKAHWRYSGKGAGKQRNTRLVDAADEWMAIFSPGPRTSGTQDGFEKAVIRRIPVSLYHEGSWRYIAGGRT